jgi:PAS domain S-box-containing protein
MNALDYLPHERPVRESFPTPTDLLDFFDNGAIPLHFVGGDGTILYANKAELALLGYEPHEYLGRRIGEFYVDREASEDVLARLARGDTLRSYAARLRAKDGAIKHVEITSSAHFQDGLFVNTRCFSVDVTDLVRTRQELRNKDDQMRQILDALPAAVYTTDSRGVITYFNRAAVDFAGRTPTIGEDQWCVTFRLRTSDGQPLPHDQCPMAIVLKESRPVRGVEAMAERPDGSLVPFMPFPTPLFDEAGALVGAVNMLVDVSARKEAEANQKLLVDELNHRVKNNMQMLTGLLSAAQRETESREARIVLGDAARRVAAIASAQQILYRESAPGFFGCRSFLEAVCRTAQHSFGPDVAISIDCGEGNLRNDTALPLALILNELLTNAAKYGRATDSCVDVNVSLQFEGETARLSVADGGPGFEPAIVQSRRASGLGLVRALVTQLDGTLTIDGTQGGRATVIFPATPT